MGQEPLLAPSARGDSMQRSAPLCPSAPAFGITLLMVSSSLKFHVLETANVKNCFVFVF